MSFQPHPRAPIQRRGGLRRASLIDGGPRLSLSFWGPAVAQFEEALRLKPDWQAPAIELAKLLATTSDEQVRDPRHAVDIAEALNRSTMFGRADLLDLLAAAYASEGRFDEPIGTATRAHQLAVSMHQSTLAGQIADRLALYRAHRPYIASAHPPEADSATTVPSR